MEYIPLQVSSEYSLLESSCRIDQLVKRAKEMQLSAIALTDHNVMYGTIPFYKECIKNGIKPIIGLKVNVKLNDETTDTPLLTLLAKNENGYRNLLKISSEIMLNAEISSGKAAIREENLSRYADGLIAISSGLNGVAQQYILYNDIPLAEQTIQRYVKIFSSEFYLGLQDHGLSVEKKLNMDITNIARENDVPLVVTQEIYYLDHSDAYAHECLLCIKSGSKLSDANHPKLKSDQHYFKAPQEIIQQFQHIPEAIKNTSIIADKCHVEIPLGKSVLPKYPLPKEISSDSYLRQLCENGLEDRYTNITAETTQRLDYELSVINEMGFNDYFLIVWDFMNYAHQKGILTGPGRGSAAGSLVAYLLKITDVDPIEHHLLFERFLNPERVSMPDIDIDFPDTRREEVIQYVKQKYGSAHVAQIVTFGTLAARAVVRDVGRVLGIDNKVVDKLAKLIPAGLQLEDVPKESKDFRLLLEQNDHAKKLYSIARVIEGLPRHVSTHAAGVIISEDTLTTNVPIQEGHEGVPLTQYDMEAIEAIGLLKMDFLGLRNLTLLEQVQQQIYNETGHKIDLNTIPYDDSKTFELLSNGDTTGIFQLESDGMRNVLKKLKPTSFEDIVAVSSLYRPGPMENIPYFIKGKAEPTNITYPHPDLKGILETTYGVIVYQEQIMQIASKMAGFSLGEADLLRRAVSKKKKSVLDEERIHFINGALKNGYESNIANKIYDLIVRFANYGFNRSHAVAYSVISYRLAYLKANYPLYFMAALLSSTINHTGKIAKNIQECKQRGIAVFPPSINKSIEFFSVEDNGIRVGLLIVKNVGIAAIEAIIKARNGKPFADIFDFCARISLKSVNQRVLEALIFAGCFDEFGQDRATLLATLQDAIKFGEKYQKKVNDSQLGLFTNEVEKPAYPEVPPFDELEKLNFEKDMIGLYLSGHPVEKYRELLLHYQANVIGDVPIIRRNTVRIGGMVTSSRVIKTKKGDLMAFLELTDETGEIDVTIFPSLFNTTDSIIEKGNNLFIEASIENKDGSTKLIAKKMTTIDKLTIAKKYNLYLKITAMNRHKLKDVKEIIRLNPGNSNVYLFYEDEQKAVKLGQQFLVQTSRECINKLNELLGNENVVVRKTK